jgi:hypothetical protein
MHRPVVSFSRNPVLLILLLLIVFTLSSCTTAIAPELGEIPSDYIALPPDREAESRVMAHIEFPPPSFEAPDVASFEISFANVHQCHGRDFVTIRVENTGDFDFIWASEWLLFYWNSYDEMDAMSQYNVAKPFMPDARSCPTAEGYSDLLEPGDAAYIGVYVGFDFDDYEYEWFGDRGWDDILRLTFYVDLSTDEYPYSSGIRPRTLDITFVAEDMPERDRRAPTPAPGSPPTSAPAPTATKMPGIGG